jgi:hypothetical protein
VRYGIPVCWFPYDRWVVSAVVPEEGPSRTDKVTDALTPRRSIGASINRLREDADQRLQKVADALRISRSNCPGSRAPRADRCSTDTKDLTQARHGHPRADAAGFRIIDGPAQVHRHCRGHDVLVESFLTERDSRALSGRSGTNDAIPELSSRFCCYAGN